MTDHPDIADHAPSATYQVLSDLELHGYRPSASEPDPRDCPEDALAARAAADILTVLVSAMADTALDWDLDELLWPSPPTTSARPSGSPTRWAPRRRCGR